METPLLNRAVYNKCYVVKVSLSGLLDARVQANVRGCEQDVLVSTPPLSTKVHMNSIIAVMVSVSLPSISVVNTQTALTD